MTSLPTEYQSFIALSRYAKWIEEKGRRETWEETVERYLTFFKEKYPEQLTDTIVSELRKAILNLEVMPSMRCLMTAGKALERDNVAGFNCSFVAVDNPRVFDEILYVLMCGTGVGFSVERQFVSKLPEVAEAFFDTDTTISVADSKIGWAKSLRELISMLYAGQIPKWDLSKLRPAGAKLKTFGGRSSGPEPLNDLFKFTVELFKGAAGRKLSSIECHDLVCKIAQIVVVGGVRRSALISLSNLSDDRMRGAKSGQWWEENAHRSLANNSACYTEKPEFDVFLKEWLSLHESKAGERGIFSRVACKTQSEKNGRRDSNHAFGTNPCCFTSDMKLLVSEGGQEVYRSFGELSQNDEVSIVNSSGNITKGKVWSSGVKETVVVEFEEGLGRRPIKCTPDHLFKLADGAECRADSLAGKQLMPYVKDRTPSLATKVKSVFKGQPEEVFDFTEPETHWGVVEGCVVHNSEIILRPAQFCNLSEAVVRSDDTLKTLKKKVRLATILGTLQSSLTDFRYLRKIWKTNTEEEALLGVSLTGIMDNPMMSGRGEKDAAYSYEFSGNENITLSEVLEQLKKVVIDTNKEWAERIGVNQATATSCVKPSGTVSQLVDAASGIHPRYSPYYIRRVRADKKDPLAQLMEKEGFSCEPDVNAKETVLVFSFPHKAPENAVFTKDVGAMDQLRLWEIYQDHWCEHKPSITVYYKDSDFLEAGQWVYNKLDKLSGVSFLPYSNHTYQQAPYEEIDRETYDRLLSEMPKNIDWTKLGEFEKEDETKGTQELACSANGGCEIVDLN